MTLRGATDDFIDQVGLVRGARPCWFFEAAFGDEPLRLWTGEHQRLWQDVAWLGSGALVEIGPIEESATSRATATRITLRSGLIESGADVLLQLAVSTPVTGRPVKVWRGFLTEAGELVDEPLLMLYGRGDQITITGAGTERRIELMVEHLSRDQNRGTGWRHTHVAHKAVHATDDFFIYAAGIEKRVIIWPRLSVE